MTLNLNELQRHIITGIRREDKIVSARCGWGSGKTSGLIFALWFIAKTRPGTSSLLVTDTNGRYNSVLMPEIEKWLEPIGWVYNHTMRRWTDTNNGSTVWCRSYFRPGTRDATHNPLEGLNVTSGVALIDECQTLEAEVAHKALGRLRSGRLRFLSSSVSPSLMPGGVRWPRTRDTIPSSLTHTSMKRTSPPNGSRRLSYSRPMSARPWS